MVFSRLLALTVAALVALVLGAGFFVTDRKSIVGDGVLRSAAWALGTAERSVRALRSALAIQSDELVATSLALETDSALASDRLTAFNDPPDHPDDCASAPDGEQSNVVIGDRVALRFFERMDAAEGQIAFERLDLGDAYAVEKNGEVSLPLLGRVVVVGRSLACVEALVAARYRTAMGVRSSVSAAYAERPSATIFGEVRAPGTYRVDPGATVGRLLALAGALSMGTGAGDPALAHLRGRDAELGRLEAGARLALLAREAAARRATTLDLDRASRAAFEAALDLGRIGAEERSLAETVAGVERRVAEARAKGEALRARIALLKAERAALAAQIVGKTARLDALRGFQERGVTTLLRLTGEEADLNVLERANFALVLDQAGAEAALAEAERAAESIVAEHREAMAVAVRSIAETIDSLGAQRLSILQQVGALSASRGDLSVQAPTLTIIRHYPSGPVRLSVAFDTIVLPGDVVLVGTVAPRLASLD